MERMESRVFFERRHSFGAGGVTTDTAPVRRTTSESELADCPELDRR